ncbi:hypothetical protein GCM10025872_18930 [Barrientosiimonas endolithica]|uniref:tryptophan synthase n=1 Tax=Barrientosiimonas endolithica TaxID=1535208 RepID=A0ABN6YM55_9MICO|nr:hypothetical protein GCM10025872_18930 [Barrientosiimonas endolithica]
MSGEATSSDTTDNETTSNDATNDKSTNDTASTEAMISETTTERLGRFGDFGGRYVPEALVAALEELDEHRQKAMSDPEFLGALAELHRSYTGRPSIITEVPRFAEHCGGARVVLKREDLNHTGSHKINNVLGQVLLTKRMGKSRVIAETGAGQHGVATATGAALLGLECTVYMGRVDTERQALNVARMRLLGAEVVPVDHGSRTLKDAVNEAFRDWVTNVDSTHYVLGTVTGPYPFPEMVRDFHRIIGVEARQQVLDAYGRLPDAVCACVGGGSNAMGIFHRFVDDPDVRLIGLEGAARVSTRAGTPPGSPARPRPGCCTAPTPTCCRTTTARRSSRTRSPRGWTTPAWGPSTRSCATPAAPSTPRSPTTRRWRRSRCWPAPRGSCPRSSRPTRSPAR